MTSVTLVDAREELRYGAEHKRFIGPELRGYSARIDKVYVPADTCPHWLRGHRFHCRDCQDARRIADTLGAALGVSAVAGLPRYDRRTGKPGHPGIGVVALKAHPTTPPTTPTAGCSHPASRGYRSRR